MMIKVAALASLLLLLPALASFVSATVVSTTGMHRRGTMNPVLVGFRRAILNKININTSSSQKNNKNLLASTQPGGNLKVLQDHRGGAAVSQPPSKPPGILKAAYALCGVATMGAWSTVVFTSIRSNQPMGAMMPTWQHGFFARIGAWSALPIIAASFVTCAKATHSWDEMSSTSSRRHNLGLAVAGLGNAIWVQYAHVFTRIPGSDPVVSHQAYQGLMKTGLTSCFAVTGLLGATAWAMSLPPDVRKNPLTWPGRVANGVTKSLFSLTPKNMDDPVNVKYAFLATSFIVFTGLQLGSHPLSVIPSWTGRRLARCFPAWTLLAACACLDLKQERERDSTAPLSPVLSAGLKGFGATYLVAKTGAVLLDPSWPGSYHAVIMVPAWATAAILIVTQTLRPDKPWVDPSQPSVMTDGEIDGGEEESELAH